MGDESEELLRNEINDSEELITHEKSYGTTSKSKEYIERDIDEIFEKNGPTGCLHLIVQLSTFYLFLATIYNFVFSFFTGNDPPWRCVSYNSSNFCKLHYNQEISIDNDLFSERCNLNRSEWKYITGDGYSFVTEFDLVCGKTTLAALISSSYYIGGVLGAIVTGTLADTYGRTYVLLFSALFTTISSIAASYITSIWHLFALNIIRGAGNVGSFYTTIVYQSEFSAPSHRSLSVSILLFGATCSYLFVDLLANYVRNWRNLSTYAALPSIPIFIVFFFLPESPRWLLVMGKKTKAEAIMTRVLAFKEKPDNVIRLRCQSTTLETKYTYLDFVRSAKILKLTITVILIWFVLPVVYYSIALQSANLGGNMYVAFALSTIADLPAYFFSTYLSNKFGRKRTNLGCLLISGILMGSMVFVPKHLSYKFIINITISIIARCAVCISFCGMYTWTFELFPTILRSQALSLCAIFDRLGMFVVPFIIRVLQNVIYYLPSIIMCVFAIFASIVGLYLPETNKKPTKERYEDFFDAPVLTPECSDINSVIENPNII